MRQTGEDMLAKYKETSRGGLAVNVVELRVPGRFNSFQQTYIIVWPLLFFRVARVNQLCS